MSLSINPFNSQKLNVSNTSRHISANMVHNQPVNTNNLHLDKLTLSDVIDNYKASNQKLKQISVIKENTVEHSRYDQYFSSFVNNMEGVTEEEKKQLEEIIKTAIRSDSNYFSKGSWTSDKASMYHLQTSKKLQFLAEQVVPKTYKESFVKIADKFTADQLDKVINKTLETYQIFYNRDKNKSGPLGDFARNNIKSVIQEIHNGNHLIQIEQKQYEELFSQLNFNNPTSFKHQYEEVITRYKEIQGKQVGGYWNDTTASRVEQNMQLLRKDWNAFIGNLSEFDQYRITTTERPTLDIKV